MSILSRLLSASFTSANTQERDASPAVRLRLVANYGFGPVPVRYRRVRQVGVMLFQCPALEFVAPRDCVITFELELVPGEWHAASCGDDCYFRLPEHATLIIGPK